MRHVKSFSDFVNEDWQPDRRIKSGAHQGFLTAYVDPDRTPNLKPDSIGFERVLRMLHAMESGKKSQMELAKVHDEGEPTHSGPFQRPDPGHKSTNNYVSAFSFMVNKGYAKIEKEGTKVFYSITPEGKALIHDQRGENLGKDTNII